MKPIYVFGHKNPDTDSVCSAIGLAHLKNAKGINCVPKVIGPINRETKFVLDYFNVDTPSYLNDTKVQIRDVSFAKKAYINEKASIDNAFNQMKKYDLTAIPLVDDKRVLTGYVTLKNLAKYLVSDKRDQVNTNLKNLLQTLDAKLITNFKNEFKGRVTTVTFSTDAFIEEVPLREEDILVVGDRYRVIEYAIESKVQLIILTRNRVIPAKLLNKAIKNKVNIITSSYSSFELSNKVTLANYISTINENPNPKTVEFHSYYTDFVALTKKFNHTNYPVVNQHNECLGVIKLTDSNYEKKQVMIVDHNNYEQSIDGLEEAEILEVFDHHNIGNIGTNSPIYFTCRPVGCTGTIIYDRFNKEGVKIPQNIAGILLSAIISDTLLFTSPTTTEIDKTSAYELAKIAKVDVEEYGMKMLKEASSIKGLSVTELIMQDFKSYSVNDKVYGIAVITTMDFDEIEKNMDEYINKLNEMSSESYEAVLIFIVDILKEGSYILYNTASEDLINEAFELNGSVKEGIFIKNLMSRKKQIIPALMKELEK